MTKQRNRITKINNLLVLRCKQEGIPLDGNPDDPHFCKPHANTIRNRIHALSPRRRDEAREGRDKATKYGVRGGGFVVDFPLQYVQIDHTRVDVILRDEKTGCVLGRPWITVAIDVFSRMIVGYYIAFETPGALGTGLCVTHAILPKDDLAARSCGGIWRQDAGLALLRPARRPPHGQRQGVPGQCGEESLRTVRNQHRLPARENASLRRAHRKLHGQARGRVPHVARRDVFQSHGARQALRQRGGIGHRFPHVQPLAGEPHLLHLSLPASFQSEWLESHRTVGEGHVRGHRDAGTTRKDSGPFPRGTSRTSATRLPSLRGTHRVRGGSADRQGSLHERHAPPVDQRKRPGLPEEKAAVHVPAWTRETFPSFTSGTRS